jgi:hypothetical protein
MRLCILTCAATMVAASASAEESALAIVLLPGHPVYHETEARAGVVMALSITPVRHDAQTLTALCEELRVAAGLQRTNGENLPLEVIFVVPYKDMAVEGFYLSLDGQTTHEELVRGGPVTRATLDNIVGRAGIPPYILDETGIEHEISCETREPAWLIRWEDVHRIGAEAPETVIDRAHQRFMAIHAKVLDHAMRPRPTAESQSDGSDRAAPSLIAKHSAPESRVVPRSPHVQP